jgi:ankyrin repeat protein
LSHELFVWLFQFLSYDWVDLVVKCIAKLLSEESTNVERLEEEIAAILSVQFLNLSVVLDVCDKLLFMRHNLLEMICLLFLDYGSDFRPSVDTIGDTELWPLILEINRVLCLAKYSSSADLDQFLVCIENNTLTRVLVSHNVSILKRSEFLDELQLLIILPLDIDESKLVFVTFPDVSETAIVV